MTDNTPTLRELVRRFKDAGAEYVLLTGSFHRGDWDEDSDVDLVVQYEYDHVSGEADEEAKTRCKEVARSVGRVDYAGKLRDADILVHEQTGIPGDGRDRILHGPGRERIRIPDSERE